MARLQNRFLATNAVSTDKVVDENITKPKLAPAMLDTAEGLAVLDANRKLSIDRIPQSLIDQVDDHENRLNVLEGRQTLHEAVTLTQAEIDAKAFDLSQTPAHPSITILQPTEGSVALIGVDYIITGATISWDGKGLESIPLAAGDVIQVWYDYSSGGLSGDLQQEIADRIAGDNALDARLDAIEGDIGAANGIATLDAAGKVPVTQLPNSIMEYQGTWDVVNNVPALADGAGNSDDAIGNVYRVAVAGSRDLGSGTITFGLGDYAILNASKVWEKADTTDAVSMVNGKTGNVELDLADFDNVQTEFSGHDTRISALENRLVGYLPIGAVIATMPHLTGAYACTATTAADANGFVQCNGQIISDPTSPMDGAIIPNINNDNFLMGRTTSGMQGGNSTYDFNHSHDVITNVAVAAHASHTHSVTSDVTIANHTITQPAFSIPGHYHGFGAGSGLAGGGHTHRTSGMVGSSSTNFFSWTPATCAGGSTYGFGYGDANAVSVAATEHGHTGTIGLVTGGSNGNAAFAATRTTDVALNAHGVTNNAVTSGNPSSSLTHTVTNNQVTSTSSLAASTNIRPPYITARYVMRIK